MNLYDIIPENLFSVLVSKNKNLYVKTLFVLLDAFKQHLKISKDELISMINAQLDDDISSSFDIFKGRADINDKCTA